MANIKSDDFSSEKSYLFTYIKIHCCYLIINYIIGA